MAISPGGPVLVDTNVLLDLINEDSEWEEWSSGELRRLGGISTLVINPIIYAEVSIAFDTIEELDDAVPSELFRRDPLPFEAGFLAGKAFEKYLHRGGTKTLPMPDFYIGAHAAVAKMTILTRDPKRYKRYKREFPKVPLITPR